MGFHNSTLFQVDNDSSQISGHLQMLLFLHADWWCVRTASPSEVKGAQAKYYTESMVSLRGTSTNIQ